MADQRTSGSFAPDATDEGIPNPFQGRATCLLLGKHARGRGKQCQKCERAKCNGFHDITSSQKGAIIENYSRAADMTSSPHRRTSNQQAVKSSEDLLKVIDEQVRI
ncbi:hypothetical protein MZO42_11735 [Sphingomonas psychrotolerans]|uniref:Uncharacterized protein n=1 Tax=Sphingomonas psychrotolerans TaxID=1327635 RepID=A0ABU3N690_9SPHN|nr:hypothetical protein [Sphingomonas psychrotolerans]